MLKIIPAGLAAVLLLPPAASADVPNWSIDAHCKAVQERTLAPDTVRQACERDEAAARAQLASGIWDTAKAQTRQSCMPSAIAGRNASYMEVLGCVQLMEGTVLRPADQQGKPPP